MAALGVLPTGDKLISREISENIIKNSLIKIFSCRRNSFEN
jgi:hypothetical protein